MKPPYVPVWGAIACVALAAASIRADAQTQTPAQPPAPPMAKPPPAVPGTAGESNPTNPDNMPVKKPKGPATHDPMMRSDPASDAQAK
ncbi:hypothetical protein M3I53_24945 [Paraburkholderia sp. CNPSo 3272]|uniref:hypothetical protein n=1 Tax=Paraburkholderia sp. CNPSo 3272 TaxID=2940931 RepID=UPI0020B6B8EC|nr:hypothetical protein [Paraburkholderia sp. CNPSo 3272]MCP3726336.1 hypothetical protein [Paraburkholderia sp. CNPSo 3272]